MCCEGRRGGPIDADRAEEGRRQRGQRVHRRHAHLSVRASVSECACGRERVCAPCEDLQRVNVVACALARSLARSLYSPLHSLPPTPRCLGFSLVLRFQMSEWGRGGTASAAPACTPTARTPLCLGLFEGRVRDGIQGHLAHKKQTHPRTLQ